MVVYIEQLKESIIKFLELISEFNKALVYTIRLGAVPIQPSADFTPRGHMERQRNQKVQSTF
jgi:hypothetical protein